MSIAANLAPDHRFSMFYRQMLNADGTLSYALYNRFPIGGHALIALAILPFGDDLAAQLYAARTLMLLCFAATAVLAYLSLCRLTRHPWIATTATLLAFSSFYFLFCGDEVSDETGPDLIGAMMTFHGMVLFVQEGRFRQLLVKTGVAVVLGWHVYALLLPFIALGLAGECIRARSVPFKQKVVLLIRSRYVVLGLVASLVGLAVLTFNFANEYVALKGEKSLVELPSFQSMMYRMGMKPNVHLDWGSFLWGQFSRIGGMSTPYFIWAYFPPRSYVPLSVGVGIGVFVLCVLGAFFTRPRILWTTLVLFGFCWALPMRHNTSFFGHNFESLFYIGVPLVFFSLVLLCLWRRFTAPPLMIGFAGLALIAFVLSSFQMSSSGYNAEATQRQKATLADFTAIRRLTADGDCIFVPFYEPPDLEWCWIDYYLNRRIIQSRSLAEDGFAILYDRMDTDALLTPKNERIFLYDSKGLLGVYRQEYQRVVSNELVARSTFDVYRDEHALYYVKTPCSDKDAKTTFSLRLFPTDEKALPVHRRLLGYDNYVLNFKNRALRFDDKCLARIALPPYDIARIETGPRSLGQSDDPGVLDVYRQAYQRVVSNELVARSTFDVYRDEHALYYVKTPCSREDVKTLFFLHIFPTDGEELPVHRGPLGYDNYDFHFTHHGLRFDNKCLTSIELPQYDIAHIKTGQFNSRSANRLWEAEISLNDRSK